MSQWANQPELNGAEKPDVSVGDFLCFDQNFEYVIETRAYRDLQSYYLIKTMTLLQYLCAR